MRGHERFGWIAFVIFMITAFASAKADTLLIKCEGTYLPQNPLQPEEVISLLIQINDLGKVIWVQGDGLTKVVTTRSDEDHISFTAETNYAASVGNIRYSASFDRKSGDGVFSYVRLSDDGKVAPGSVKAYQARCVRTTRAL